MRCLQCGKALPLLKRWAGGEFCSDAHRKEYQQEYTNLALRRLQQAVAPTGPPLRIEESPKESRPSSPPPSLATPIAPPAASVVPPAQPALPYQSTNVRATPPSTAAQITSVPPVPAPLTRAPLPASPVTSGPAATAQLRRTAPVVPRPQPKGAPQRRDAGPALAGVLTRKPQAAKIRRGRMSAPLEVVLAGTLPALPRSQDSRVSTSLATASSVYWAPVCERRESPATVMESKLDARGFARTAPVMDVGMSVIPPRCWDLTRHVSRQSIPMMIPDAISPGEPVLWNAPPRPFTGSVASLDEWAALLFSTIQPAEEVARETQTQRPDVRTPAPEPFGRSSSKILTLLGGSQES